MRRIYGDLIKTYVNLAEKARAGNCALFGSFAASDSKRMKLEDACQEIDITRFGWINDNTY